VQAYEYAHAPFGFADNIYTSVFYMATGFHGFPRDRRHDLPDRLPDPRQQRRLHPPAAFRLRGRRLVWHFVDVVWLFLFLFIYVWGGWGAEYH
jgi:cytochrome c oxidase subunit 3